MKTLCILEMQYLDAVLSPNKSPGTIAPPIAAKHLTDRANEIAKQSQAHYPGSPVETRRESFEFTRVVLRATIRQTTNQFV